MLIQKETIKEMRARHAEEIRIFQENCKHEDISGWMPSMWAPGHFGPNVRICNICDKIVEKEEMNLIMEDTDGGRQLDEVREGDVSKELPTKTTIDREGGEGSEASSREI